MLMHRLSTTSCLLGGMSFRLTRNLSRGTQRVGRTSVETRRNSVVHISLTGQASPCIGPHAQRNHRTTQRDHRSTSDANDSWLDDRGDPDFGRWYAHGVCAELRPRIASATQSHRPHPVRTTRSEVAGSASSAPRRVRVRKLISWLTNKDRLFSRSEQQSYPGVGRARSGSSGVN